MKFLSERLIKRIPQLWKHKKNVTQEFIHAVITLYAGYLTKTNDGEFEYEIIVKKKKMNKKTKRK